MPTSLLSWLPSFLTLPVALFGVKLLGSGRPAAERRLRSARRCLEPSARGLLSRAQGQGAASGHREEICGQQARQGGLAAHRHQWGELPTSLSTNLRRTASWTISMATG